MMKMVNGKSHPAKLHLQNVLLFFVALLSTATGVINGSLKCKDESGADVDWFLVYKLPKIRNSPTPKIRQGLGYSFILPKDEEWQVSSGNRGIDENDSILGLTLLPLFHENQSLAYILYNDQPPFATFSDSGGHTKGIILANSNEGIWIQHSVPHFPSLITEEGEQERNYSYPKTGQNNGQILHCLSLSLPQVDNIGNILQLTKPHVYNFTIPDELRKLLPTLGNVVGTGRHQSDQSNGDVNNKIIQIQNAGRTLYSFAKGPSFHQEIYSDWIAPKFKSELDVQSWLNGPKAYPSNCTSPSMKVYNIDDKKVSGSTFSTHSDHSKWAISTQQPLVCIGDLNRMEHQMQRGGTVNCFMDKYVWKAFKKTVLSTQPCSKPTKSPYGK